jgi:transcriptional regulator with XRE-family HTH domain
MSHPNQPSVPQLLVLALDALGITQGQLGDLLGVSRRTISRWTSGGTVLSDKEVATLARAVYPKNASLAAQVAAYGRTTLEQLGIVQPPKPALPPPPPPPPPRLVDVVVYAAADALDASPRSVRRAVIAAFEAALEVGLDVKAVVKGLRANPARAAKQG